jgi:hypothetical protein
VQRTRGHNNFTPTVNEARAALFFSYTTMIYHAQISTKNSQTMWSQKLQQWMPHAIETRAASRRRHGKPGLGAPISTVEFPSTVTHDNNGEFSCDGSQRSMHEFNDKKATPEARYYHIVAPANAN